MENGAVDRAEVGAALGPRAGAPTAPPALSASRAAVLETVRREPHPATLSTLTAATGLHANTVREHLEALIAAGWVRRQRSEPSGRGRPAWRYAALDATSQRSEYAGLAATLASVISRTSQSPREDAIAAGAEWGRDLARGRGQCDSHGDAAGRREVVRLLRDLGFAPEPDDQLRVVRLTRCPLLDTARRYPDVVCGVHLGIVRGALDELGGDSSGVDLVPFAEPGACRLDLAAGALAGSR